MQLPYFYTATNRANVHLSLDMAPTGMTFQKAKNGLHGQLDIVGMAFNPDGGEVARFADTVNVDVADQPAADAFVRTPWHYEHAFTVTSGAYVFQIMIGAGPDAIGRKQVPLNVDPAGSVRFGMGGIALSTKATSVDRAVPAGAMVAGGKEFVPAATNRFRKSEHVYFYTELYEPGLAAGANASSLAMQYRVVERSTGEVKQDSGIAGVAGYVHPGDPMVPFATALPLAKLAPGSYRLEVRAAHTLGPEVVGRSIDFDVN
jgi:hypothetical protein